MLGVDYNQCPFLPKAELNTKMNPNGHHPVAVWVRFGFQLGSLEKSVPACVENRVHRYFSSLCKLEIRKISMYLRRGRREL